MSFSLSSAKPARLGAWLLGLLLLLTALRPQVAQATHIRAGDIQSNVDPANPNHIFFTLTLYVDPTKFDQREVTIFFGDGTYQTNILRNPSNGIAVPGRPDVNINLFPFDHVFPGPKTGGYRVSFIGENRTADVLNITSSVTQTFYIYSDIIIDPTLGPNHSPVLTAPAVDGGNTNQVYFHDPGAYDQDGDSIAITKLESYQVPGGVPAPPNTVFTPVLTSNYIYPDNPAATPGIAPTQVTYPGIPTSTMRPALYQQDKRGLITWNAPVKAGYYNVAMRVEEWRRYPPGSFTRRQRIGVVIRDMQILIASSKNLAPQLTVPADVCVQAGQPVTLTVTAVDGQGADYSAPTPILLSAYSGIIPPATFKTTTTGTTTTGIFNWTPDCSNIAKEPILVVFKAQDSPPGSNSNPPTSFPLVDTHPVFITVVGPAPKNLKAVITPFTTTASLTWDAYSCQNASQLLVFRREGCSNYTPGACETGLPASLGYTQIAALPVTATTYQDGNRTPGVSYSYRIYATFPLPAGGNSVVSNEACVRLGGRSSLLTNVDVLTTSTTTGQIAVKWTKPRNDGGVNFTPEYGYRLSRSEGTTNNFVPILERKNSIEDTTFVDTNLNTQANQYTYRLVFYRTLTAGGVTAESPDPAVTATSVRASLVPDGNAKTITVNWAHSVPWDNSKLPTTIYRRTGTTGNYAPVGTATSGAAGGSYVDAGPLQDGQLYYYYVQTAGQYADYLKFLNNLLNRSQEVSAVLRPSPCTPVLSIRPINCDSLAGASQYFPETQTYRNLLTWTVGNTPAGCVVNAKYYRIYRADTEAGPFVLVDTTSRTTYLNRNLSRSTYCYQVQGVSATGEESARSNIACQSECLFFTLPNVFTPNGDGTNDVFRPKTSSPITRTHIQIFNRWGRKVYEGSADPYINWKGDGTVGENNTGGPVSSGIYYFLAEVQFADAAQTQKVYKGWVELIR